MKKNLLLGAITLAFGLYAFDSSAQIFRLRVTDYDGADAIPALKTLIDGQVLEAQNKVNEDLPSAPPERLMEGMANSSVMAGKGIGSDYASGMDVLLIGAGVGVGADLEKDETSDSDMSGVGIAPGLILGANLGFLDARSFLGMDTDRLNMYLNFMSYSHDQTINDKEGEKSEAGLDMLAMGVHFRYDWIKGNGNKLLGWGGVKLHFGYEYNNTKINFKSQISEDIDETDSSNNRIQGTITGNPEATIEVATHSIPVEISSDVQLLYFLSLYGGLGADFNFGSAKGKGNLNADESTVNCVSGPQCTVAGNPAMKVQAEANIDATGKVNPLLFRGFAGLQINLPYVRIFGQVDKAFGNELIGATAGIRFVY